jgi:hypothetical protein
MIVEPELRIPDFVKAGADIISVHAEQSSTIHLHRVVNQVRNTPQLLCHACVMLQGAHAAVHCCALHVVEYPSSTSSQLCSGCIARASLPPHPSPWHHPARQTL